MKHFVFLLLLIFVLVLSTHAKRNLKKKASRRSNEDFEVIRKPAYPERIKGNKRRNAKRTMKKKGRKKKKQSKKNGKKTIRIKKKKKKKGINDKTKSSNNEVKSVEQKGNIPNTQTTKSIKNWFKEKPILAYGLTISLVVLLGFCSLCCFFMCLQCIVSCIFSAKTTVYKK